MSPTRETRPVSNGPEAVHEIASRYLDELDEVLRLVDMNAMEEVVCSLQRARDHERTIFVAGNGGSAATASHWVNDLCKATKGGGRPHVRAICLSDNVSLLTALANDEGYERSFSGQLENFVRHGDVLVVISASGNSPNLLDAVRLARARGLATIALLGFDGGALKDEVDHDLHLRTPIGRYGLVESGHSVLCDILTTCLCVPELDRGDGTAG